MKTFFKFFFLFVQPCYNLANPKEVIKYFNTIDHTKKKTFCPGAKLLRRRSSDYNGLFPIIGLDTNEDGILYTTLCEHNPCRNSCFEFEFVVGNLVLEGKLTREQLNDIRPLEWVDIANKDDTKSPKYKGNSFRCGLVNNRFQV